MSKKIPKLAHEAAKKFLEENKLDQVVIIARKRMTAKTPGYEYIAYYGKDEREEKSAEELSVYIKYNVLGWPSPGDSE